MQFPRAQPASSLHRLPLLSTWGRESRLPCTAPSTGGPYIFFYVLHIPKETPAPRHRSCLSGEDHLAVPLVSFKAVLHEGGRYCHKNSNESSSKLGTGIYDQLHTCVLQGLVRGQPGPGEGTAGFKAVGDKRTSVQNQFHNH